MSIRAGTRVSKQDSQGAKSLSPKNDYLFIVTLLSSPNYSKHIYKWHFKASPTLWEKNKAGVHLYLAGVATVGFSVE